MIGNEISNTANFDPDHLLDSVIKRLGLKNDAALSRALDLPPPVISKIRHRKSRVGASLLIRLHEISDFSINDLRNLMGDRREKYRFSTSPPKSVRRRRPAELALPAA